MNSIHCYRGNVEDLVDCIVQYCSGDDVQYVVMVMVWWCDDDVVCVRTVITVRAVLTCE